MRARKRLGIVAWVCTRVFVDDEEGAQAGGNDDGGGGVGRASHPPFDGVPPLALIRATSGEGQD